MLVAFTVNYCVICHCAASAAPRGDRMGHCSACCEKQEGKVDRKGQAGHNDCQGMQAVKFNLLEKQVSSSITSGEQPVMLVSYGYTILAADRLALDKDRAIPDQWVYKHSPPDLQVLYQRFLI